MFPLGLSAELLRFIINSFFIFKINNMYAPHPQEPAKTRAMARQSLSYNKTVGDVKGL
jgi:hypothetical protein